MSFQRLWALIVGWALTALGIVGVLVGATLPLLVLTPVVSTLYIVTGLVALFFAYYRHALHVRTFDRVIGFVFVALAIAGFSAAGAAAGTILGVLPVVLGINVLNLAIGVISLIAGYALPPTEEELREAERERKRAA
ncbi:MAG: hypothetical protein C4521_05955 [Actinobacteria bacterium]|nr:MAG: hypothetical protein C4521_05955 [Actinomycetota bacterium]